MFEQLHEVSLSCMHNKDSIIMKSGTECSESFSEAWNFLKKLVDFSNFHKY